MIDLSREEFIELGISTPVSVLIEWATRQMSATQGRESRLGRRGVNAEALTDIRTLTERVESRHRDLGQSHDLPPEQAAMAERLRADALDYWREAKRVVGVAFATQPDILATFRTGVRTGLLIRNLLKELESMIPLLREHSVRLAPVGAGEAFATRGELLVARLKEAKTRLDAASKDLPPAVAQFCHDKGLLFHLTRNLVRVGRLEFALEPGEAAHFNFKRVRRDRGVATRPRLKKSAAER